MMNIHKIQKSAKEELNAKKYGVHENITRMTKNIAKTAIKKGYNNFSSKSFQVLENIKDQEIESNLNFF